MAVKQRATKPSGAARPAQRRRTRKAIVDAAAALLARGVTPSVSEVAAAADVSRRTIYMHFPTFDQLLIDATVGALSEGPVARAIEGDAPRARQAVEARVERLVRALQRVTPETERLGRSLIRLTVEEQPSGDGPRRGYRRLEWIDAALQPLRSQVSAQRYRRLAAALAMVIGWEALIVQRDVCGLSAAEGEALSAWAAKVLVQATLREQRATNRGRA